MDNLYKVFDLYEKYGNNGYIGEDVTQFEHAMEAALLAEEYFKDKKIKISGEIILAAFLHDVGHLLKYDKIFKGELMGDFGVKEHEKKGSQYLKNLGYSNNICSLVGGHIITKRYLITNDIEYYTKLSDASKETFKYQGGNLTNLEMKNFKNDKLYYYHLKIREWDDKAKSTDPILLQKIKSINPREYFKKYLLNI